LKNFGKVVSILLLATLMFSLISATSVMPVKSPAQQETLWGWDKKFEKWTTGNLAGWMEDDYVNYRLEIDNFAGGTLTFVINLDHTQGSVIGLDKAVQFYVGGGNGKQNDPQYATTVYVGPIIDRTAPLAINETITASTTDATLTVKRLNDGTGKSGDSALRYEITVQTNLSHWFVYWESHLAIGSSGWSGSSLHVYTYDFGSKDVPISVPPGGTISGYKWEDRNGNGIWDSGEPGLADWEIRISGPVNMSTFTNSTGAYEFRGLPMGTYVVSEVLKEGWTQTYPVGGTHTVSLTNRNPTATKINFGNIYARADLCIEKTGPLFAHVGDTVTYTFSVSNKGPTSAEGVQVYDNISGAATYSSGDSNGNGKLDVGEIWIFTSTYMIKSTDPDPLLNNATVTSTTPDPDLSNNWDTWSIDILNPAISVYKWANATMVHTGDGILYRFNVTNTGDCQLSVNVIDDVLGPIWTGTLGPGASQVIEMEYTAPSGDWINNTVTASGTDALGKTVTDTASWSIQIVYRICGYKFYDYNLNGIWDPDEDPVKDFRIELWNETSCITYTTTGVNGSYCFDFLGSGIYIVKEVLPSNWINTTIAEVAIEVPSEVTTVNFSNVCLKPSMGGKTLGFWSNKNGQALINSSDISALNALTNLYRPTNWSYPPFSSDLSTAKTQIKNYLLNATAKDMRWMLSAQLIATKLNLLHGFISNSTMLYVGPSSYVPTGFITIGEIVQNAYDALAGNDRVAQTYWKDLLNGINNNWYRYVCPEPCYPITYP